MKTKNVDMDLIGDKVGRIHVGRQDLNQLQTRKMKGLKRNLDASGDDDSTVFMQEEVTIDPSKRARFET